MKRTHHYICDISARGATWMLLWKKNPKLRHILQNNWLVNFKSKEGHKIKVGNLFQIDTRKNNTGFWMCSFAVMNIKVLGEIRTGCD